MTRILCATRGGEASYRMQDAVIALSKERQSELLFLYVVNIEFLGKTERAVRPDVVEEEMAKLGSFLLEMARERAQRQGIAARGYLRYGHLSEELGAAALEHEADLIVLGKPAVEGGLYSLEELEVLAAEMEAETGIPVQIL
ncbi:MAG: universal stress protein [Anaerolineae bacterium]